VGPQAALPGVLHWQGGGGWGTKFKVGQPPTRALATGATTRVEHGVFIPPLLPALALVLILAQLVLPRPPPTTWGARAGSGTSASPP
jgi:hypothetical protein